MFHTQNQFDSLYQLYLTKVLLPRLWVRKGAVSPIALLVEMKKGTGTLENNYGNFLTQHSHSWVFNLEKLRRKKKECSHKNLYMSIHSSFC